MSDGMWIFINDLCPGAVVQEIKPASVKRLTASRYASFDTWNSARALFVTFIGSKFFILANHQIANATCTVLPGNAHTAPSHRIGMGPFKNNPPSRGFSYPRVGL